MISRYATKHERDAVRVATRIFGSMASAISGNMLYGGARYMKGVPPTALPPFTMESKSYAVPLCDDDMIAVNNCVVEWIRAKVQSRAWGLGTLVWWNIRLEKPDFTYQPVPSRMDAFIVYSFVVKSIFKHGGRYTVDVI